MLAAQSSSRRLVFGWLVCRLVTFVKQWPLENQMLTKTYLPSNLCDSNDSSDTSDSSDSSYRSDSSNGSDQLFFTKNFITKMTFVHKKKSQKKNIWNSKTQIVMKLKKSNYE